MNDVREELSKLLALAGFAFVRIQEGQPKSAVDPVMLGAWLSTSYECRDMIEARGLLLLDYLKGSGWRIVLAEEGE